MKSLHLVARVVYSIPLLVFGLFHFMNAKGMATMVPSFLPAHDFFVYLTGIGLILAALSFLINKFTKLSGILLALMLLIFVLTIHIPGLANPDKMTSMLAMIGLLKDTGLMAGALMIAANGK